MIKPFSMSEVYTEFSYLKKEYPRNKTTLFFWSCFLCSFLSYSVFAELSEHRKVEFIEQLAQPFSSVEISLRALELIYSELYGKRKDFFKTSIKEDILNREQIDPSVFKSPFVDIIEEEHGRVYVSAAIHAIINDVNFQLEAVRDAVRWLVHAKRYLSDQNREELIKQAKNLPIQDVDEAVDFLVLANTALSGAEIRRIILKTPT